MHNVRISELTTHRIEVSVSSQIDGPTGNRVTQRDLFVKDAYLVFRALCKLTMKPLNTERSVSPVLLRVPLKKVAF